jgi:glyoxylase-like metal-dependent hydrolase (beta-lactamase superfamily II)
MEISEGVHRLDAPLGDRYVALYLLVGEYGSLLVDTGLHDSIDLVLLPYLRRLNIAAEQVKYAVVTHSDFDHMGGNEAAQAHLPAVRILSHVLDSAMVDDIELLIGDRYGEFIAAHGYDDVDDAAKDYIRDNSHAGHTDVAVIGGERIRLAPDWEVEVVHTPGHSRGSISVWDPRSRTMFIGDAVLGDGLLTSEGQPAFPPTYRYVDDYRSTIRQLSARGIETLAAAHYPLFRGDEVGAFLDLTMAYTDRVEEAILATLRDRGREGSTAMEIIAERHADLGPWPLPTAEALMYAVVGHLESLESRHRITRISGPGHDRWMLLDG